LRIANVQPFTWESSDANSVAHAASVRLRKRLELGFAAGANYTFSKSIDNASSTSTAMGVVAQNAFDLAAERGLSSFDQTHVLRATTSGNYVRTKQVMACQRRADGVCCGDILSWHAVIERPSLVLVRNEEGAWNLERWLPPAKSTLGAGSRFYGPRPQQSPSNRLQKIDIDDGRINSKSAMKNYRSRFWSFWQR